MKFDAQIFTGVDPGSWKPSIFRPDMLEEISSDAALWASEDTIYDTISSASFNEAQSWAASQRIVTFLQATGAQGMPQRLASDVAASVAPLVLDPPRDERELQLALEKAAIGIVTNAVSAVPIVGGIAAAIINLGYWLVNLKRRPPPEIKEVFRPLTDYSVGAEEIAVKNSLFPRLPQPDWTPLFQPRVGNDLRIEGRDGGLCPAWVMLSDERKASAGFVPGSEFVMGPIQAYAVAKKTGAKPCPTSDPKAGECEIPVYGCDWSSREGGTQVDWRDIGSFYPELARMMTAISGTVQAPATPLWSVNADDVIDAWERHLEQLFELASEWWDGAMVGKGTGLDRATTDQRRTVVQALVRPYFVFDKGGGDFVRGFGSAWTPGSERTSTTIVDAYIRPWCTQLKKRQHHFIGTTAVAYADLDGGALREPVMRQRLMDMRIKLLQSPYRRQVVLADVVDSEYRQALFDSTVGQTITSVPPVDDGSPSPIDPSGEGEPPAPDPPKGGSPFLREVQRLKPRPSPPPDYGAMVALGMGGVSVGLFARWLMQSRRQRSGRRR